MEIWKSINDYENYSVSNLGNVRNDKTGRILKSRVDCNGYQRFNLCKNGIMKTQNAHKLVAHAFLENLNNKLCVDHIDNNPSNNNVNNLRWATHGENSRNKTIYKNNTSGVKGVTYDNSKLKNKWRVVIQINGIQRHVGYFSTKEEAIKARKETATNIFGEYCHQLEKI